MVQSSILGCTYFYDIKSHVNIKFKMPYYEKIRPFVSYKNIF
jgi:hypothetical protein